MRLGAFVGGAAIAAIVVVSTGCTAFQNRVDINKANELYKAQRYEEALPIYQGILKRTPDERMRALVALQRLEVRCLGLDKLIAVKRAAGRPEDLEAIAELEAIREERQKLGR